MVLRKKERQQEIHEQVVGSGNDKSPEPANEPVSEKSKQKLTDSQKQKLQNVDPKTWLYL